jgi:AcrR family transcriptional regulator
MAKTIPKTKTADSAVADGTKESEKTGPRRRVRMERSERRKTLLDAGASAFASGGYAGTSMEDVASRAKVTRLIIYRHFASKEELYRAVLERAVQGVAAAVSAQLANGRSVAGVVRGFVDAARIDPDGFKLLVRQSEKETDFSDYLDQFRSGAVDAAQNLIARPVPDPVLREWAAKTLVALLEEATLAWIETGSESRDEEMMAVLTSSIEAMLGAFATSTG